MILIASDLHCGSPVGLLPPKQWQLRSATVIQNKQQRKVWSIWRKLFESIKDHKELSIVFNGDLVEGVHHAAKQVMTQYMKEQEKIAIDAIDRALQYCNFNTKTDKLYFVDGSAVHADESEERIADDITVAEQYIPDKRITFPALKLDTPEGELWVAHKGPGVGEGANEGNALYNKVRHLIVEELKFGRTPPRFVVYAHRHIKTHRVVELGQHRVDAWILPPFCAKSEFGFVVAPFNTTEVGGLIIETEPFSWKWVTDTVKDRL